MFWQQSLWEEFAAKHAIETPATLEALADLFEGQPLVEDIVSKEQFLADPVRLWAKTPDPVLQTGSRRHGRTPPSENMRRTGSRAA
jgi:hypothetical protein